MPLRNEREPLKPWKAQGTDPIVNARREGARFDRAWLKDEFSLSNLQRFGFLFLSVFLLAFGGTLIGNGIRDFRDGNLFCLLFFAMGGAALAIGFRIIWRVVRDMFGKH